MFARYAKLAWFRMFEAAVIVGGFAVAIMLGVCAGWVMDDKPIYVENPAPGSSFVENPVVRPGEYLRVSRSLRRLDTCAVESGVWIVDQNGDLLYYLYSPKSIARPDPTFRAARVAHPIPPRIPVGHYAIRSYPVCDRNPLSQPQQQLQDLPFEVVAP